MWLKIKNYILSLDDILFLEYDKERKSITVKWKHNAYPLDVYNVSEDEFNMIIPHKKEGD